MTRLFLVSYFALTGAMAAQLAPTDLAKARFSTGAGESSAASVTGEVPTTNTASPVNSESATNPDAAVTSAPLSPEGLSSANPVSASPGVTAEISVGSAATAEIRRLRLYHTHTNEHIDVVYREGDNYVPGALAQLDYFLRDSHTGAVSHYDPHLYDLLSDLTAFVGHPDGEIDVVCGYRTPMTNRMLRRRSRRVARHSLHMEAMAIDIRVPGVTTKELRNAALLLGRGGVGYYRRSHFVHVDVGPVRRW